MAVTVNRDDLVERITKAREEHKVMYERALAGWIKKMQEASKAVIARVEKNDLKAFPKEFKSLMQMPSLHLDDYDQALEMLEMSVNSTIELGPEDFDQLVLGNWSWREDWENTNSLYASDRE
jgi:DNA segregation ATPase FtsK/SpoIIIE-like protein